MKYTDHQIDSITLFGGQKHPTIVSFEASNGYIFSEIHDVSVTMEFFSSSSFLFSSLFQIRVEQAKIQSCSPIYFFIFNCCPHSFHWSLFVFSISSLTIWFYFLYQIRSILILLIVIFYSFLNFFFNFVPQHFVSFIFYSILVLIILKKNYLIS